MSKILITVEQEKEECDRLFGPESNAEERKAGELIIGEARVLCFPVRSAKGSFAWIISAITLMRYARECGKTPGELKLDDYESLASDGVCLEQERKVVLEEYCFKKSGPVHSDVLELLKKPFLNDPIWSTVKVRTRPRLIHAPLDLRQLNLLPFHISFLSLCSSFFILCTTGITGPTL